MASLTCSVDAWVYLATGSECADGLPCVWVKLEGIYAGEMVSSLDFFDEIDR